MIYATHFFLNGIGLIAILHSALLLWGMEIPWLSVDYGTFSHVDFNRAKPLDLLLHVGGVLLLLLYFTGIRHWVRQKSPTRIRHPQFASIWLIGVGAFNAWLMRWQPAKPSAMMEWVGLLGVLLIWLAVTYSPFYKPLLCRHFAAIDWRAQWNPANTVRIYGVLFVIAAGQLIWALAPFTLQRLQLLNEYLEIPTTTLLFESDQEVVNHNYYDEHKLLGPALRYFPDRDRGHTPPIPDAVCVTINPVPGLDSFLGENKNNMSFVLNKVNGRLCAVDSITSEQWLRLRMLQPNELSRQQVDTWFASVRDLDQRMQQKALSKEEKQFLRVNRFTLGFQFAGNGVIHHHGFMLNPLNEYDLGKPRGEIFAQYGWLNLWLTRSLMRVIGGMNMQNYFKVWYSYYYIYYLFYFGLLWLVFRSRGYLAAGALLSVGLLCFIEFQWLMQAPGINPIRRIMELPLMAGLLLYWQSSRRRYLVLIILSLWLFILNNWQFGLMALATASATLVVWRWKRVRINGKCDDVFMMIGLGVSVALIFWMRGGSQDPLSTYYLAGSAAMPLGPWLGVGCLVIFSLGATVLLRTFDSGHPLAFLSLFLLLYTAAVMTYSLWNGSATYLLVPGPLYVLVVLAYVRYCTGRAVLLRHYEIWVTSALVGIGLVALLTGGWNQERTRDEFLGLMASHKTYEWNIDRAQLTSTMDPRYFEDGVALIQRYSIEPGIYIISKYDNFLPFLAQHYSAMPYFEVSKFLVSPREAEACIERLLLDKPEILFVDTDINRDYATDIVHRFYPFSSAREVSRYHVAQLMTMRKVFTAVQNDYELVETGLLISVYKRK